jgi:hypothetical protein
LEFPTYKKPYGDPYKNQKKRRGRQGQRDSDRGKDVREKKTYRGPDRVTVLGLVCVKMTEQVVFVRQEEEDRRVRQEVCIIPQEESVDGEGMVDDDVFQTTEKYGRLHRDVGEEDLETTEGEGVDFLVGLLEVVGGGQVDDEETEKDLS